MTVRIMVGDVREQLALLPDDSVHCVITSPPYWGLRNYGVAGQIGLEPDFGQYVETMVAVFRDVRRVLRPDGTLWLNLGDSYHNGDKGGYARDRVKATDSLQVSNLANNFIGAPNRQPQPGLKPKDLVGMPWRVAFALQADGWWLREDIIWAKPNPMPESVTDRCTRSHEYIFHLTKSERYFHDAAAIREPFSDGRNGRDYKTPDGWDTGAGSHGSVHRNGREKGQKDWRPVADRHGNRAEDWDRLRLRQDGQHGRHGRSQPPPSERNRGGRTDGFTKPNDIDPSGNGGRNKRSVWTIASEPFPEAHFATFPTALVEPCILAGTSAHGVCASCGAPWARITETSYENPGNRKTNGPRSLGNRQITAGFEVRLEKRVVSLGWTPTCGCGGSGTAQATVLDPFGGAGTTGLVADRLRRNAILIELNPEYAEMARRRIERDAGMFGVVA